MTLPRTLVVVWLSTAVLTGPPGILLLSFAEDGASRVAAFLLIASAVVEVVTAVVVRAGTRRVLHLSLAASALVLVLTSTAQVVLGVNGHVSPGGAFLFGGCSLVGAVVSAGVVALRLR